jgi:SET family sugar efflux transporter-like MFS transporter
MLSGSVALPLYVTRTLARADSDVGLLFSICALAEIPAALSMMLRPANVGNGRVVILLGMLLLGAYFLLVASSSNMPLLIATQLARGVALAVVGALGIT